MMFSIPIAVARPLRLFVCLIPLVSGISLHPLWADTPPPIPLDPTLPSPPLRQAIEADDPPPPPAAREMPVTIPDIKLRARMVFNAVTVAVIEMEGNHYVVSQGDELMIRGPGGTVVVIEITELNSRTLGIRVPPLSGVLLLP